MAVINIDDAYILEETGAQVDKVTGLFTKDEDTTSGEKAFAQLNIGTAGSNRNLLDNPFFTVNQRGYTSGSLSAATYWADRWLMNTSAVGSGSLSLSDGVVSLTAPSGSSAFGNIYQRMLNPQSLDGKVVTLSALKADGTIISGTVTRTYGTTQTVYNQNNVRLQLNSTSAAILQVDNGASISIKAMKLELGSCSTLANDVPPDYKTELDKCQYYCRVIQGTSFIAVGQAVAATGIRFPLPYVMRARPTATLTGTAHVYGQGGPLTPSALSCTGNTTQGIEISTTVSGATSTQSYMLVFRGANDKIVISADL